MFRFTDEFPNYKLKEELREVKQAREQIQRVERTCARVFDEFLAHCEMRVTMNDMAFSTLNGYRKIIDAVWRPQIGEIPFADITYSQLANIVATHAKHKKTYNNVVSVIRCAFDHGYKDHPERHNPASGLSTFRITKKDRPPIDPFTIQEGELIVAESHREFGLAHGNYEEFRFFTGLRPSEEIALQVTDCDLVNGTIEVTKARVLGREKDRTKTGNDRTITLCGRALEVLKRHFALREQMVRTGQIHHAFVFFQSDGAPIVNLSYPYDRWRYVLEKSRLRYRDSYNARHSYISWSLMIGKNVLLLAEEDGHSVHTMLTTYARWTKGARESDIEVIRRAMQRSPVRDAQWADPCSPQKLAPGCHQKGGGED